ncbi:DUF308 domain-containing protein [Nocardia sp. NPDC051570]|uniref:DUF308 domain-containing protein n=1 Tax=Nocardia sp. NPDC051570 TaxID=3364324 RepID=UPI003799CE7B
MPTLRVAGRTDLFAGDAWQAAFVIGCASVGLGVVLLVWPDKSVRVSELLFGLCLLLTAAWQLVITFGTRIRRGLRIMQFLTAGLTALLAVWCVQSGDWVSLLALWVGMGWAMHGIVQAIIAVWSDELPDTGRSEVVGMLTLVAGLMVIVWPIDTMPALSVLVGVLSILLGGSQIRIAARIVRPLPAGNAGLGGLLRSQPHRG